MLNRDLIYISIVHVYQLIKLNRVRILLFVTCGLYLFEFIFSFDQEYIVNCHKMIRKLPIHVPH